MCFCCWSYALFFPAWKISQHSELIRTLSTLEPSTTGFNEPTPIYADRFCCYRIFICWLENLGAGKNVDVSWIPNIIGRWWVKQTAGLNGTHLTQRLATFQNITRDHSLNRLDDTFSAKHKPENGTVILLFALFLEKSEGKLSTFLKRQWAFCIPDLSLAEGMLISCWAMALIILAKAKMYTSWLTLVSTGCWSTPKRLCALLP